MSAAFVYVISGDHGRQKIGSSDNPRQRIKDLQTGSPFPLKFEFIGETENLGGGAIEVEAHFMLNQHRAEGEWFVVPSDVAITAVMAAAHRLGYRCKPVDIDSVKGATFQIGTPLWQTLLKCAVAAAGFYPATLLILRFERGELPVLALAIEAAVLLLVIKLAQWILVRAGVAAVELWSGFNKVMGPESWPKPPEGY
jgi:hypothetical protein